MHALRAGPRRELLDTQQRSFDVTQELWRLAGTNPQPPAHAAIIDRDDSTTTTNPATGARFQARMRPSSLI
jgi:hypothetical protein